MWSRDGLLLLFYFILQRTFIGAYTGIFANLDGVTGITAV